MNLKPSWQTVIVSYFWAKHKHETHTLVRLCLIKFLSARILQRGKGLVDYQGREQQGWGPVWPLYQSRKLHSALSEIVSLVELFFVKKKKPFSGRFWFMSWVDKWMSEWEMYVCHTTDTSQIRATMTNQSNCAWTAIFVFLQTGASFLVLVLFWHFRCCAYCGLVWDFAGGFGKNSRFDNQPRNQSRWHTVWFKALLFALQEISSEMSLSRSTTTAVGGYCKMQYWDG